MILVKKKYLYILSALVILLLILGELRFFHAIKTVELITDLEFKYELENFIFASVVLVLIVCLFLIYFVRQSDNVLKRLDKLIQLSEYGKHDISGHLQKIGKLGGKVDFLLYHYKNLNDMKSLKISSLSHVIRLLVEKNELPVFLLDRHGNIINCSEKLLTLMSVDKGAVIDRDINTLFKDINSEELYFDLEKTRNVMEKDSEGYRVSYYPVTNSDDRVSNIIGVIQK